MFVIYYWVIREKNNEKKGKRERRECEKEVKLGKEIKNKRE